MAASNNFQPRRSRTIILHDRELRLFRILAHKTPPHKCPTLRGQFTFGGHQSSQTQRRNLHGDEDPLTITAPMRIEMRIDTRSDFMLFHVCFRRGERITQPDSLDRTLTAQDNAPIRSQTLGPATLGGRWSPSGRSMPRQLGQPQHGSDRSEVQGVFWTECLSNCLDGSSSYACRSP